jgi:hypothetical protein
MKKAPVSHCEMPQFASELSRFVLDTPEASELPENVRTVYAIGEKVFASEGALEVAEQSLAEVATQAGDLEVVRVPWSTESCGGQYAWYETAGLVRLFPHYAQQLGHLAEQIRLAAARGVETDDGMGL